MAYANGSVYRPENNEFSDVVPPLSEKDRMPLDHPSRDSDVDLTDLDDIYPGSKEGWRAVEKRTEADDREGFDSFNDDLELAA